MGMRIETRESTTAKIADKLGLNEPSAFDLVDRSKYADDESYLDAVIKADMERNNPEYQAARRRLKAQYREKQEREQQARQEAAYKEIRSAVKLDSVDIKEIDAQAVEMAKRDLAAGKISASGLGAAIDIILQVVETLTENVDKLVLAANEIIIALAEGLVHSIPTLIKAVPKLIAAIVEAFSVQVSEIVDIGKNIVKGVYQGILNMASWFKSKVKDFFSGIVDSVKGLLGIHSPSKVFAGIGQYMMQGLSNGLDSGVRLAVRSARAAALAVENAATPNVQFGTHYFRQLPSVRIPALATGAVIPPNREFMAVLGDQKSGNNIEAPEDLIRQIVREESGGGNAQMLSTLQAILQAIEAGQIIEIEGQRFAKIVHRLNGSESSRVGVKLVNT